jgi:hypothetical protein
MSIFQDDGIEKLKSAYALAKETNQREEKRVGDPRDFDNLYMTDLLQGMVEIGNPPDAIGISGGWVEIDDLQDLKLAQQKFSAGQLD